MHLTLDMAGQRASVRTSSGSTRSTTASIRAARRAFTRRSDATGPICPTARSPPAYAGVRPKIVPPGAPAQDFVIEGPRDHGVPGLVNLFGIESPGLTASLAIAEHVAASVALTRRSPVGHRRPQEPAP